MSDGVVMLVNEFPPLPVGGAERQAERLSGWLAARGWKISVLTRGAASLPSRETRDGFEILRIRPRGPGKLKSLTFVLGALWTLFRRRHDYKILHAHLSFGPAFAAVIAARLLGKRVIVKLGNSGEYGDIRVSQKTFRGRMRLFALRRWADAVIALDDAMQAEALAAGFDSRRLRRMNNGIEFAFFSSARTKDEAKSSLRLAGKTVVMFMGRLSEQKSLPTLLNAFSAARKKCPALHLLLLGDGPSRSELEFQAEKLGITSNVTFAGSQRDVRPYLEAADIFGLPSVSEGISNALLEAMSAGLACVVTPVGGNADVLDNGACGLLLPPRDESAWAASLAELGNDSLRRERLGAAARSRVRERYDFSVVGGQYESLYRELTR
ncbi:MAG: glycosyltransferase family 4 protein [Chloroflexota bacterium]